MKILAFAATNHTKSINKQLVEHALSLLKDLDAHTEIELLDLADYELPLYSQDRQQADGIHHKAEQFFSKIGAADALIIAFAEHNGSYTAVYKNLFDWASRINQKVYQGKHAVLLSTSYGKAGAASVLKQAVQSAKHYGMELSASLSIPAFSENFSDGKLINVQLNDQLREAISSLKS